MLLPLTRQSFSCTRHSLSALYNTSHNICMLTSPRVSTNRGYSKNMYNFQDTSLSKQGSRTLNKLFKDMLCKHFINIKLEIYRSFIKTTQNIIFPLSNNLYYKIRIHSTSFFFSLTDHDSAPNGL